MHVYPQGIEDNMQQLKLKTYKNVLILYSL